MTPSEKAKELVLSMHYFIARIEETGGVEAAERCAIVAIEEILQGFVQYSNDERCKLLETFYSDYWNHVKEEIEIAADWSRARKELNNL